MITNVSLATVWVTDLDEAKTFYIDVLGFAEGDDLTLGPDFRWLTVFHPDHPDLHLHLSIPGPPLPDDLVAAIRRSQAEGGMPAVGLNVDDCHATHAALAAKGVEFLQEPQDRPYGVEALMRDNSGNWLVLVEKKDYTEADFEGFAPD